MDVGKEWPGRNRESIEGWIATIDECLKRYFDELPNCDMKLADYLKLAELEAMVADEGEERTVMRWVTCRKKSSKEDESER